MSDIVNATTPFLYCFGAGIDRQSHPLNPKEVVQLFDGRCVWLINERMVDIANGSSSLDAGEAVDGEDLLESED